MISRESGNLPSHSAKGLATEHTENTKRTCGFEITEMFNQTTNFSVFSVSSVANQNL